jgi:hypothetical protein
MRRLRRGNATTNFGIIAGGLLFSALVVDLGWAWSHQARIQHINDAVAAAAASRLDNTEAGLISAQKAALEAMTGNDYFGAPALTALYGGDTSTLVWGQFDPETRIFEQRVDPEDINAVRVSATNNTVPTIFSGIVFGREFLSAGASAVAVTSWDGASEVGCYLPIAVPSCYFTEEERESYSQRDYVFQPATADNVSWASTEGNPSAAYLTAQIEGTCTGGLAGIGDTIHLNNGMIQSVLSTLERRMAACTTTWDAEAMGNLPGQNTGSTHQSYGCTFEAPVFVFNAPASYCAGGNATFTGSHQIDGIAWGVVYDIKSGGAAADRNAWVRFDFARWHDMGSAGGGPNYGVRARGLTQLVE